MIHHHSILLNGLPATMKRLLQRIGNPAAREVLLSHPTRPDQEETERRFFSSLRLKNGTLKVTASGRHDDLNALVAGHLPTRRPLRLMDVGISSGVTTLEWLTGLRAGGFDCTVVATDLTVHARLWTLGGILHILTEEDGHPLQYEVGGLAVSHAPRRIDKLLFAAPALIASFLLRRATGLVAKGRLPGAMTQRRVVLTSPRLLAANGVEVIDDDVLLPWTDARRFDVVRVANVLNPAYFNQSQLKQALSSLHDRLASAGLLVLCRTHMGKEDSPGNHASIFRLNQDGRLSIVARLRHGSELEQLALGLAPRTHP